MKVNRRGIWLGALSLAAFIYGMSLLFRDRLEAGDIYPAYSTLRSDPLGCRALFSALERYPDLTVKRAFSRTDFRGQKPGAAYFFLGLDAESLAGQGETLKELDSLARQGHRVVLGLAGLVMEKGDEYRLKRARLTHRDSASQAADSLETDSSFASALKKAARDSGSAAKAIPAQPPTPDAMEYLRQWGFRVMIDTAFNADSAGSALAQGNRKDTLPWLSGLYFDSLKGPWTVWYRRDALPVAMERTLGSGSIALVSDTYFASNQAQFHSSPALLAGLLVGGSDRVFFDERHFGVRQDDAIASLLRKYRLHWALPSLLLLLGLYIWKGRNLLLPETEPGPDAAAGPDARSALAGLLRRNLTAEQALETCYGFWKEGAGKAADPASWRLAESEIKSVLERRKAAGNVSLAAGYGEIQAILNRRKRA